MPSTVRAICAVPGCPRFVSERGRCRAHRTTTTERGYGSAHQAARADLAVSLPAECAYGCGRRLTKDSDWVAAHVVDGDPMSERVAACRTCNERAKTR